jgi:hypothetical protein
MFDNLFGLLGPLATSMALFGLVLVSSVLAWADSRGLDPRRAGGRA